MSLGGHMSEKNKKLCVRIVCACLAFVMVVSCVAVLVPFL